MFFVYAILVNGIKDDIAYVDEQWAKDHCETENKVSIMKGRKETYTYQLMTDMEFYD